MTTGQSSPTYGWFQMVVRFSVILVSSSGAYFDARDSCCVRFQKLRCRLTVFVAEFDLLLKTVRLRVPYQTDRREHCSCVTRDRVEGPVWE